MTAYHDHSDMKHLKDLKENAPREFAAWLALDNIVGIEDGAIPRKYRELIALAAAHVTQCPYCLDAHTANAVKVGATKQEVAETGLIAAALRAGAGATHAALVMKMYDEHAEKANKS
ncbi:AhpD family alkylhydroperoxidase [Antricoccus suffuscus]|uniref:AhpD family alkylhydroperoxidase n=1 Tax=Antricoccus suffuscus TaxID=1629062 RepID=A0A2T0ZYS1_9ACTN|nr:carboxymuconolactone decarboxylase family protein [Antricoccus suffuscus]PRZ41496.1 AhpD family alkylhydroperoxidase [Antricoccus suffuscus]